MYAETFAKKWPEADNSLPLQFSFSKICFCSPLDKIKPFSIPQNQNCQNFSF